MPDAETPIRVGLDGHAIGRRKTGNESYVLGLASALAARPDVDLTLYIDRGVAWPFGGPGPQTRPLRSSSPYLRIPLELPIRAGRDGIEILHVQYVVPPFIGVPLVTAVHDLSFEDLPSAMPFRRRWRLRATVRHAARRSAMLLAPTEFTRRRLLDRYRVPADRVVVASPGVVPPVVTGPIDDAVRRGLPSSYVLFTGEVQPRKNLPRLVDAIGRVRASGIDIGLVIAGRPGWGTADLDASIARHHAAGWVRRLGYVDRPTLQALYAGARLIGYPSLYEGFGLPVVEGMAAGVPVVTSSTTAIPEVAGGAAVLVDPLDADAIADAIARVSTDETLRSDLIAAGVRRAADFRPENVVEQTVAAYRRVIDA